jgi:hypothetical protein
MGIALLSLLPAASAMAQAPAANTGAVKLTAGLDVPSLYYFRGLRQEADPKITLWPYGDVGVTLKTADAGLKSVAVNFGVWNSLHTGSAGSKVTNKGIHYEEDFYTTLTLGFSAASTAVKWIAYTSPNGSYSTVQELDFTVTGTQKYAPYGIVAFELSDASADGGAGKGTYLELGATPSWPLGGKGVTLAIPLSLGMSLNDYYELGDTDNKFGFFDAGALVTVPFSGVPAKFGSWNVHFRGDYIAMGDTTKAFNKDKSSGGYGLVGLGFSY